jgi:hypothetical protein
VQPVTASSEKRPIYDRALLLHGPKRNEVLTLDEVQQYGLDSFSDADYVRIYGMLPAEWYRQPVHPMSGCNLTICGFAACPEAFACWGGPRWNAPAMRWAIGSAGLSPGIGREPDSR